MEKEKFGYVYLLPGNKFVRVRKLVEKIVVIILLLILQDNVGFSRPTVTESEFRILNNNDKVISFKLQVYNGEHHVIYKGGVTSVYYKNKLGFDVDIFSVRLHEDYTFEESKKDWVNSELVNEGNEIYYKVNFIPPVEMRNETFEIFARDTKKNGYYDPALGYTIYSKIVNHVSDLSYELIGENRVKLRWKAPELMKRYNENYNPDAILRIHVNGVHKKSLDISKTSYEFDGIVGEKNVIKVETYVEGREQIVIDTVFIPIPTPQKPKNLKSSLNDCNGEIKLTWDYNGDVEVDKFYIENVDNTGESYDVDGDKDEYIIKDISEHSVRRYRIKSIGKYAESDLDTFKLATTSGLPQRVNNVLITPNDENIVLEWDKANYATKYKVIRNGANTFNIEDDNSRVSFTDNSVKSCESIRYEIYSINECTEKSGSDGVKYSVADSYVVNPNLSDFITEFEVSKAYFSDKVLLNWRVKSDNLNNVDYYRISRRRAVADNSSSYNVLATVEGESSYDDKTSVGGVLYEYKIEGVLFCENKEIVSNTLYEKGFRLPYGVVKGNIEYENKTSVKNVKVIAEKSSGINVGYCLNLTDGKVTIKDSEILHFDSTFVVEAYLKPTTITSNANIISTSQFTLKQIGDDVSIEVHSENNNCSSTAHDILGVDKYTHISAVLNDSCLMIFVDGDIPTVSTYIITDETLSLLSQSYFENSIIEKLTTIKNTIYQSKSEFVHAVEDKLGANVAEKYLSIILPIAENRIYKDGAIKKLPSKEFRLKETYSDIIIGDGYNGFIDEIRLWNIDKSELEIKRDYSRILSDNEIGIVGYWRCDENFGRTIYDASKRNGEYNKSDGVFSATGVNFSGDIPSINQLGWSGITDENGAYTIPYIPYMGTGENFSITPIFEQHEFSPTASTVFIGEGASVLNNQNYTDISSVRVTGTVYYENTNCGVEAVILKIDGEVIIQNGKVVMTNQNGEFDINVPVGRHYVSVMKNGHKFLNTKFPPGPENITYNFQEDITGINFLDTTKVKVVGRVVGGTTEGNKVPGLGLSTNNIGVANFKFESVTGPACSSYEVSTDTKTGEYTVWLPPMSYKVKNFAIPKNIDAQLFFSELEIADFSKSTIDFWSVDTSSTLTNITISLDTNNLEAVIKLEDEEDKVSYINYNGIARFEYKDNDFEINLDGNTDSISRQILIDPEIDSCMYNFRHDFIYRSTPEINVYAEDAKSEFIGDSVIIYTDGIISESVVVKDNFLYPVFQRGHEYSCVITASESYYNNDNCPGINGCPDAVKSTSPIDDGEVFINNKLAQEKNPDKLNILNGKVIYQFIAGSPNTMMDANFSYRSFTNIFNLSVTINGKTYNWKPNKDKVLQSPDDVFFRAYVLGSKEIIGSDFITKGPQIVEMILRDPPGSESYAYMEKGSSTVISKSLSLGGGFGINAEKNILLGTKYETGTVLSTETKISNSINLGLSVKSNWSQEKGYTEETIINERIQTEDSHIHDGQASDLYIGASANYIMGLSNSLKILPDTIVNKHSLPQADSVLSDKGVKYRIALQKGFIAAPTAEDTRFIYSHNHIESTLIPNLIELRNNLFVQHSDVYHSFISKGEFVIDGEDMYGANNDDIRWIKLGKGISSNNPVLTELNDTIGVSYRFNKSEDIKIDGVRNYNQQIRLWREALERNEREKYHAKFDKNISFDAGPQIESSHTSTITKSITKKFELNIDKELSFIHGVDIAGIGTGYSMGLTLDLEYGNESSKTVTETKTFGYVLSDPNQGDYFSVDIKDPQTGTGPVFFVKGGRSMCPHEKEVRLKYYEPRNFEIDDKVLDSLERMKVPSNFLYILNWSYTNLSTTGFGPTDSKYDSPYDSGFTLIGKNYSTPKIKGQRFSSIKDLRKSVYQMIDLNYVDYGQENCYDCDENDIRSDGKFGKFRYLIDEELRNLLKLEFEKYRSLIERIAERSIQEPKLLSNRTVRREVPTISVNQSLVTDVPADNRAYFNVIFGNLSESNDVMWYEARVLEESNPFGAVILLDGDPIHATYEIQAGQSISKTMSVGMGRPDVFHYDNLKIALYSPCEWEYRTDGMPLQSEAIDTVTISVHFVPACTDINVMKPLESFVINRENQVLVDGKLETKIPAIMNGYDLGNIQLEKIAFQYKGLTEPEWTTTKPFFKGDVTGDSLSIEGPYSSIEWDLSDFPDGKYQVRAKSYCKKSQSGENVFDLSDVWTGTIDRRNPEVFGSPQPADGILSPDDEITIEFSETIFGEKLTKNSNFDIRGVLNGSDIKHDVSLLFDNDDSKFARIPDGIDIARRSFTIEFWVRPERTLANECLLSQYSDSENCLYIGFSAGKIVFKVGDEEFEIEKLDVAELVDKWSHLAFVYDDVREEAILYKDGKFVESKTINTEYTGFGDIFIGKSLLTDVNPYKGSIHELRIWERPRTASKIFANMLINLSGKETGLVGYWPMDEAFGTMAKDRVHQRTATVNTQWRVYPSGFTSTFYSDEHSLIDINFSDVAFTDEQDFSIEYWFKSGDKRSQCFLSNGRGDYSDKIVYYLSAESLYKLEKSLPLVENLSNKLNDILNHIYVDSLSYISSVSQLLGEDVVLKYQNQIIRYGKVNPTYWSINTDAEGFIQVNNNSKRMKLGNNDYIDNRWHHFALVVERNGNTRVYIDGEERLSQPSTEWSGFGGAKLFIGARAHWDGEFSFDEYYNGSMDDIRIWNKALKQSQINRNKSMRLDGDELGLVAYLPFESYEEVMGVPIVNGIIKEFISNKHNLNASDEIQITDINTPNIRMKRPTSKVNFKYVFKEDRIAFEVDEPSSKIENCILDITVQNVEDMYGNKMQSPVTWSAYIDMNQTKWDEDKIKLSKRLYEPLTFSTKINNFSGKQQNFSIENLPVWISAEPKDGTLNPLSSKSITFTIHEALNVGSYLQNIDLKTDFEFNEKFQIDLRVYKDSPEWDVSASKYQYSMNLMGYLLINNVVSVDKYDKVAAFVDGECRGVANLEYVLEYDRYMVFMDIYSNNTEGERVTLKVWDASEGLIINDVSPEINFRSNSITGTPSLPEKIEAKQYYERKINLNEGWNWISFNLEPRVKKGIESLEFTSGNIDGDQVKSLGRFAKYSSQQNVWGGNIDTIHSGKLYMMSVKKAGELKYYGSKASVENEIVVERNWNWLGYLPQFNLSVTEAFSGLNPANNDVVKSQYAFSLYDINLGWIGSLKYLTPDAGYMYKSNADEKTFKYPSKTTLKQSFDDRVELSVANNSVNKNEYSNSMSVVAKIEASESSTDDLVIMAFIDNDCRGIAESMKVGNELLYFITIYGDKNGDKTDFVAYDKNHDRSFQLIEKLNFNTSKVFGDLKNPIVFSFTEDFVSSIDSDSKLNISYYPNPFLNEIEFEILTDGIDKLSIFNSFGQKVHEINIDKSKHVYKWVTDVDLASGVYYVVLGDGIKTFKIIKL